MSEIITPGAPTSIPAGYAKQSVSGGLPTITLSANVAAADIIEFTGTLTAQNLLVVIPQPLFPTQVNGSVSYSGPTVPGWMKMIKNSANGPFQLILQSQGGTNTLVVGPGTQWVFSPDGVNLFLASAPTDLVVGSLAQTAWFIDPQNVSGNASDTNTGLTAQQPLLTIGQLAARWGTTEPDFGSETFTTVVTFLSNTNAADPWNICAWVGTVVVVMPLAQQATGTMTTFTPYVVGPPAALPIINAGAGFAWAPFVGMWVQDTQAGNLSWFRVIADTGGGTATVTQPAVDCRSNVGVASPDLRTPANGDSFTVFQPGTLHITRCGCLSTQAMMIIQNAAPTAVNAGPTAQVNLIGEVILQQCIAPSYVTASSDSNEAALGNNNSGKPAFTNSHMLAGCDSYDHFMMGGSCLGPFVLRAEGSQALHGGRLMLLGTVTPQSFTGGGRTQIGEVAIFCSALNLLGGGQGRQTNGTISSGTDPTLGVSNPPAISGPTNWPIKSLGWHMARTTFVGELKVGGIVSLCGVNSGATYTPATGVITNNVAVTLGSNAALAASTAIDAAITGGATGVIAPGNSAGLIKET